MNGHLENGIKGFNKCNLTIHVWFASGNNHMGFNSN
jgi:hypothetical protein